MLWKFCYLSACVMPNLQGQNAKLSVEETLPDPRYVLLQNEEYRDRILRYEIQANQAVRFPDAFANCLMQCLRVFRCCHRHHSDHNVPLSVEESEMGTVYLEALVCE
ncbi:hypothetical protein Q7C36_017392 [Tachysurus vachellii]|uniref:Uncharacterized protein n=1 Tax=Tachysurus vachellii TaxID=175792 RepID=A0AA88S6K9_TACVA|nr:hypothetical protein Q7C36_017392 [Tachysurus vachellii]